jgi:hypothetical protein
MKEREEQGRPRGQLTTEDNITQNQEQEDRHDSSQELVKQLQDYVKEQEKIFGEFMTREEIIRIKLNFEEDLEASKERSTGSTQTSFFAPLRRAWDALAYERYEPGSIEEHHSGALLSRYYHYYSEPIIRLSDPLQVQVIDALTEACGIPHQPGQTEIAIPERLKRYDTWTDSPEYRERLSRAKEARRQKGEEHYARLCSEPLESQK